MNKKLLDEYMEKLEALSDKDTERWHEAADEVLCDLLRKLGYGPLVDKYEAEARWFG